MRTDSLTAPAVRNGPLLLDIGMAEAIRDGRAETLRPVAPARRGRTVTPFAILVGFSIGLGIGIGLTAAASLFGRYFPPDPLGAPSVAAPQSVAAAAREPTVPAAATPAAATPAAAPAEADVAPFGPAVSVALSDGLAQPPADPVAVPYSVASADPVVPQARSDVLSAPPGPDLGFAPPAQKGVAPFRLATPAAQFAVAPPSAVAALAPEPAVRLPGLITGYAPALVTAAPVSPGGPEAAPAAPSGPAPVPVAMIAAPGFGVPDTAAPADDTAQAPAPLAGFPDLRGVTLVSAALPPAARSPEPELAGARLPAGRPVPAFPNVTLLVMAPGPVAEADLASTIARLAAAGFTATETRPTGFVIRRDNVRYYHPEDRPAAEAAALALGAEPRDFTGSGSGPPSGRIEVWLKTPGTVAPAAKPAKVAKAAKPAAARPAAASQTIIEQALRDRIIAGLRTLGP
ncbi:MAG: hypothetical protein ACKVPY_00960 [Paracoccaceae bacterium]